MGVVRHPLFLLTLLAFLPSRKKENRVSREAVYLALAYTFAAIVSLYAMGKFLVYHFDPLFLMLSIFGAQGIAKLSEYIRPPFARVTVLALILLLLIRLLYPFNLLHYYRAAPAGNLAQKIDFVQHAIKPDSLFGLPAEDALLAYLSRPENASGTIEFCSITPAIRWRSERQEATRFTMIHAYGMQRNSGGFTVFQQQCRMEFLDSLRSVRPRFLILANGPKDLPMFRLQSPSEIVLAIPGVQELVSSAYSVDTTIRAYTIYRRRS
jgi:hypothetical protein